MGSSLTPENLPASRPESIPPGHDMKSLGPSDSSDSGSDMTGATLNDDDTTEAELAGGEDVADASDITPEHAVDATEAGLGGGLDEAEEANLGITNEDFDAALRNVQAGNTGEPRKGNVRSAPRAKP